MKLCCCLQQIKIANHQLANLLDNIFQLSMSKWYTQVVVAAMTSLCKLVLKSSQPDGEEINRKKNIDICSFRQIVESGYELKILVLYIYIVSIDLWKRNIFLILLKYYNSHEILSTGILFHKQTYFLIMVTKKWSKVCYTKLLYTTVI